MKLFLYCECST